MALELKEYQKRAIGTRDITGALSTFFERARGARDAEQLHTAFNAARRLTMGETLPDAPYRPLSAQAPEIPQVCLRIPTGGGKTLLAAHSIERAASCYVGTRYPVVLWMVPTNTIRTQTLDALRSSGHPYRDALRSYWPDDQLMVLDITECAQIRKQDFGAKAIIIVCTRQTLQVENTSSRDVYAYKETFEPHFSVLKDADFFERIGEADLAEQPFLREILGESAIGRVKYSFANLLAWHRPIVIVDEAHNARGDLSYEVFRRIRPACVIEWTATPAIDQNVLYHVSAQALKDEQMIKLPIQLAPHPNWQEAVRDAVETRKRLADVARGEPDYVRPIVLFQADPRDGEVPVERLVRHLTADLGIEMRRIAVATGTQRGLDGVNLFDPNCPIDFVVTVEALKEGWDCSFTYVFCTMQNIRSAKDMEQLLGRVLRMPYARTRRGEVLNRAYAHVCAQNTALVANQLVDRLVTMGFEEMDAPQYVQPGTGDLFSDGGAAVPDAAALPASSFELSAAAAEALRAALAVSAGTQVSVTALPAAALSEGDGRSSGIARAATGNDSVTAAASGVQVVTVTGVLSGAVIEAAVAAVPSRERNELRRQLERHQGRTILAEAPAQRGVQFGTLPRLAVPVQGKLHLLEPALLSELTDLSLAGAPADLEGLAVQQDERPYLVDVEGGRLQAELETAQQTLDLNRGVGGIERADLIREIARRVRRDDVLPADLVAWLGRVLDALTTRGIEPAYVARYLNQVAETITQRLAAWAQTQRGLVFQQCLEGGPQQVQLSDAHAFRFDPNVYPARSRYNGRWVFAKHFYGRPGELQDDNQAEETGCAIAIDSLQEVKYWVRNLELQAQSSFWLPTSTDRFYPDFVAQLEDGRMFVIEYKGGDRYSNNDSREKRDIGEVWARSSGGRCLFAMVTDERTAGCSVVGQMRRCLSNNTAAH